MAQPAIFKTSFFDTDEQVEWDGLVYPAKSVDLNAYNLISNVINDQLLQEDVFMKQIDDLVNENAHQLQSHQTNKTSASTHIHFLEDPIGEADIELQLLTNVAIKKVNKLFGDIDRIRGKEITFGAPLVVAVLGIYMVYLALGLYQVIFMPPILVILLVGTLLTLVWLGVVWFVFRKQTCTQASYDARQMGLKYAEIHEQRRNVRNLKKTFQRMLQLKTSRSTHDRNKQYLRKVNLLRIESIRLFQTPFSMETFEQIMLRVQEIVFLDPAVLARMYQDMQTQQSYAKKRSNIQGKNFGMHILFSQQILLYMLLRIQLYGKRFACPIGSKICQDNLYQYRNKLERVLLDDKHPIYEDIAALIHNDDANQIEEEYTVKRIKAIVAFTDLPESDDPNFENRLEELVNNAQGFYQLVLAKVPPRRYEHVEDANECDDFEPSVDLSDLDKQRYKKRQ